MSKNDAFWASNVRARHAHGKRRRSRRISAAVMEVLERRQLLSSAGIGVNFTGTSGQTGISLNPSDTAGLVPLANYNNFTSTSGSLSQLTDSTGAVISGASMSVAAGGSPYAGDVNTVPAGGDGELMKGGLTSGGAPGVAANYTVSITLPPALFASGGMFASGFDLFAYSQCNSNNDYMVSSFSVAGSTQYVENAPVTSGPTFNGTYVPSSLTAYPADNTQIGNYVHFASLDSTALANNVLTLTFSTQANASGSANGYERGEFNGFELVPTESAPLTVVVNSTSDTPSFGATTLRQAIDEANNSTTPATITFDPNVFSTPQTITLSGGTLQLSNTSQPLSIIGPAAGLTISGNNTGRGFQINTGVTAALSDLTVSQFDNTAITNEGNLKLSDVTVSNNVSSNAIGAGIYNNSGATLSGTQVTVSNNSTGGTYGAGISNSGAFTLTNSTVSNNTLSGFGGAGIQNGGTMTLTNVTVAGNSCTGYGGGIYNTAPLTLQDDTISNNSAHDFGGGIFNYYWSGAVSIANCIDAGNTCSGGGQGPDAYGTMASQGGNLAGITDGSSGWAAGDLKGTGSAPLKAALASLGYYGGPTQTMPPQAGSPAIGAGSTSVLPSGLTTDQRGQPRTVNAKLDIGADQTGTQNATTLVVTQVSGYYDGSATLTAMLASGGTPLAGQPVSFKLNSQSVGTATTNAYGVAILPNVSLLGLTAGTYSGGITATYAGNSNPTANYLSASGSADLIISLPQTVNLTVTSAADPSASGQLTLRGAIAEAANSPVPVVISFSPTVFQTPQIITLSSGALAVGDNSASITIVGPAAGVTISGNHSSQVFDTFANVTLQGLTITGGSGSSGGAINNAGNLTISGCTISNSHASGSGGGILSTGTLTVLASTLSGNSAASAGAIDSGSGTLTVIDSTFCNNSGTVGAIWEAGAATISDSTIDGNQGTSSSAITGGMYAQGSLTIGNSIVAQNTSTAGSNPDVSGAVTSQGYNLIGITGGSSGWGPHDLTGNAASPRNPQLSTLGMYGGLTATMLPLNGSGALSAGSAAIIPSGTNTDQRGVPRVFKGTVDIGAVEVTGQRQVPAASVASPDATVTSAPGPLAPKPGHTFYVNGQGSPPSYTYASAITPNTANDLVLNVMPFDTNYSPCCEGNAGNINSGNGIYNLTNGITQTQTTSGSGTTPAIGDGGANDASNGMNVLSDTNDGWYASYHLGTNVGAPNPQPQLAGSYGYDISEIDIISGHQDYRTQMTDDILVQYVGSSDWVSLSNGNDFVFRQDSSGALNRGSAQMAIVNPNGGPLAMNVANVKFVAVSSVTWLRELVVTGTPSSGPIITAPPATPAGVATSVDSLTDKVTVTWTNSADPAGWNNPVYYEVQRATSSGGPYTTIAAIGSIAPQASAGYVDDTITPGVTYYYRIGAYGPANGGSFAFSGSASAAIPAGAGHWTTATTSPPSGGVGTMLLLTDGSVIAEVGDNEWARLVPDSHGSYLDGTWTTLPAPHDSRLYCSTQVLPDGRLFVAGGEYGTGGSTGEIYDPRTNAWTLLPAQSFGKFSDSGSMLLPNGTVLISPVSPTTAGGTVIYNPATNTWSAGPSLYRGFDTDEQSFVRLADNSILTIDGHATSERYIPTLNQWVNDGAVPVDLWSSNSEMGPAFLLPDGRAFFSGGNGRTALYTPSGTAAPGTWVAGPTLPNHEGILDGPGAMLPDGTVLLCVSTGDQPRTFVIYNPVTNSIKPAALGPNDGAPYTTRMLVLPDGNVLVNGNSMYEYSFGTTPLAAAKPVISTITPNTDGSYHLAGTGLNGISGGAAYGDDAQMDSNYPIVRLTSSSGTVYFATTRNWTIAVETGVTPVSTDFVLPVGIPLGTYSLAVIANGVASASVSFTVTARVYLPAGTNTVTLSRDTDGSDIDWTAGTSSGKLAITDPNGLTINGNGSNDTIALDNTRGNPLPASIHLNGTFTLTGLQSLTGTTLDIGKSTVFISYASGSDPLSAIQQSLKTGYNSGNWNGQATSTPGSILSSAAGGLYGIGYADSADASGINTTANTIELKYTVYGDANLDGTTNLSDFLLLPRHFAQTGGWDAGDFNYDGSVTLADLLTLTRNFGKSLPPTLSAMDLLLPSSSKTSRTATRRV